MLIKSHKERSHQIVGIGGILHVPVRVADQWLLPPIDQAIQRRGVALLQGDEAGAVGGGIVEHRRGAALSQVS